MRDSRMDNIRFGLIFLVVLGHFFEASTSVILGYANEFIYSFHMPVFVFISGYFAKFNPQRIVKTYLYSYVLMQIVYFFFLKYYIGNLMLEFQLSIPHYTLWYLLAMAFYCMIIPLINTENRTKRIVFVISVIISLIIGVDSNLGYTLAATRFFGFLPFFVLGFYFRNGNITEKFNALKPVGRLIYGVVVFVAIAAIEFFVIKSSFVSLKDMIYVFSYNQTVGGWRARIILLALGILWILFLLIVTPNKKICIASNIGANTFPVYLFHGLCVKILLNMGLNNLGVKEYTAIATLLSVMMLIIFGNKTASSVAKWLFTGHWLDRLDKKEKATK